MIKRAPRKNRRKKTVDRGRLDAVVSFLKVGGVLAVLLAVSGGFIGLYGLMTGSDSLRIHDIQVKGASSLSAESVIRRAGIQTGANILAVNLSKARRRLAADPWIAEARIIRSLPATIVIDIREHVPVAVLDWDGGFLINSRRKIFKRLEATDGLSLPVVSGLDLSDVDAAGRAVGPALNAALDVIETAAIMGRRNPDLNVQTVAVDRDMGLTLLALGAIDEVRLGFDDDNDDYVKKFRRLNHMLRHRRGGEGQGRLAAAGLEYPDRVVVRTTTEEAYAVTQKGGHHEGAGHHRRS